MMMRFYIFFIILLFPLLLKGQDSLTLNNALQIALEKNYDLIIVKNDQRIADNNNTFGNAGFLPSVAAEGTKTYNISSIRQAINRGDGVINNTGNNVNTSSLNSRAMLNWTVFDGFSMFVLKSRLTKLEELGETQVKATVNNTVARVISAYFAIAQQQKLLRSLTNTLRISNERVGLAEVKSRIGAGSGLELLQAQVDRNADSSAVIQQIYVLKEVKAQLNTIMAREDSIDFIVDNNIPINQDLKYELLRNKVLDQNPHLIAAKINLQVSENNISMAKSALYPRIGVFAGYSYANSKTPVGIIRNNKSFGPTYGVTASIPIFNGFNNYRDISNAKIQLSSSEARYKSTEQDIRSQLYTIYNEYKAQLTLIYLETQNVDIARRNTEVAYEKLKLGAMSDLDFRATQQKQIDAENRLFTAQYQAKLRETQLLELSGEILK